MNIKKTAGNSWNGFRNIVDRLRSILGHLKEEVIHDHCLLRASSLAFSTLLALVPLTAFIFSLFTGFGAFQDVKLHFRQLLVRFLVPTRQEEILHYIDTFVENSRTMGAVGLLLFAITSIFLLNGVAENINAVWGSSSRLGFIRKFSLYISILVFGTLLIGVGFTFIRSFGFLVSKYGELSAFVRLAVFVGPSLIVFLIHWLIIYSIPSAKVRLDSSIIGAVFGTVVWETARFVFVDGTNYILRMSLVYGSIASVPIFLVWLSIQWLIILVAVEIAYIHQHGSYHHGYVDSGMLPPRLQISMGLRLYLAVVDRFYHGQSPYSIRSLAQSFSLSPNNTEKYLRRLQQAGLITYTHSGPSVVLPGKEPAVTEVKDLLRTLFGGQAGEKEQRETSLEEEKTGEFFDYGAEHFSSTTILDLIQTKKSEREGRDGGT